ncbi:MAG: hypothetical protein A3H96_01700 [Acidobacteria bacterium RIFCSPLOWO2_02_FULL_67_36]|nr:MAG: hypothetical protein A3H96_01700 [Acidobacteria bacterium RIFCSPLOWO2_02_FULL_67_36]OFW19917.1 MAG: hypothetical protein A3G21_09890 [Acidobacteria bacterium RIFCSPLOWO2_12_FULL_66_21]
MRRLCLIAAYVAVTAVMAAPMVNYRALASASYVGDARLIIWTLAWDNHATLLGLPAASESGEYDLVEQIGSDYLFKVRPDH